MSTSARVNCTASMPVFLSGGTLREEGTAQKLCGELYLSIALHPSAFPLICKSLRVKRSDDSQRAFASFPNPCCIRFSRNFGGENCLSLSRGPRSDSVFLPRYY